MRRKNRSVQLIAALVSCSARAWAIDISACGQAVPDREIGEVTADIDCTGAPPGAPERALLIGRRATLRLNGHELRGITLDCGVGGRCTIQGPGTVTVSSGIPTRDTCVFGYETRLTMNDVIVDDCADGILAAFSRVTLTNVTTRNNTGAGVIAKKLTATTLSANDNGGAGIVATASFRGTDITANANGSDGLQLRGGSIERLDAIGNGGNGLVADRSVRVLDGTLTGNVPYDVLTNRRPRFTNVTCDRSFSNEEGASWSLCALDPPPP